MSSLVRSVIQEVLFPNRDQHPIPVMDGNFSPNDGLERCAELASFDAPPDDVAIGRDGAIHVSCGRTVMRAAGAAPESWDELVKFPGAAGGLAAHPDGRMLVCVAGEGLAAVAPDGGIAWLRQSDGQAIGCPTSVAVAADGVIYLTDGSATNTPDRWTYDLMEGNASGRLIRCDAGLGNALTLRKGLAYPHGCVLTEDDEFVLFSESWSHTVTRCDRDGRRPEPVVRNLPGYPARLSGDGEGGFWLSLFALRTHLVELVLEDHAFKSEMMASMAPQFWIAPSLRATGSYLEPLQGGGIKKLGILKPWAPPRSYGLVVRIDAEGAPLESLHSRVGGGCHGVTAARRDGPRLLIVSKGHQRLLMHRLED